MHFIRLLYLSLMMASLGYSSISVASDDNFKITIAADPWCPYNCNEEDERHGFMIELATVILAKQGITVDYINMPWARAIKYVLNGKIDGIVGVGKDEVPELVFPSLPMGIANHTFYTLPHSNWQFNGIASLADVTLGTIKGYSYRTLYNDYISVNESNKELIQTVTSINGLEQLIGLLEFNRVDAIIEDDNVIRHHFSTRNTPFDLRIAGVVFSEEVYVAFSPHRADAKLLALALSVGIENMRKSGELEQILSTYGLEDWQTK